MKYNNSKISIIIPTYNRAELLPRTIKSILNQTLQNFEILLVDDGSTDNTKHVIKNLKTKKIRYFYQNNKGPAAARNLGIKQSQGNYIAFMDSDDSWMPNKLQVNIDAFKDGVDWVFSNGTEYDDDANTKKLRNFDINIFKNPKLTLNYFLETNGINACCNIMIKTSIMKENLFDENLYVLEDPELLIRISRKYKLNKIDDNLYIRNINKSSLHKTISYEKKIYCIQYILNKHQDLYSINLKTKSIMNTKLGIAYMQNNEINKARRCFLYSFKLNPLSVKSLSRLILSIFGYFCYKNVHFLVKKYKLN